MVVKKSILKTFLAISAQFQSIQVDSTERFGTSSLKLEYKYNSEPPKFNIANLNLGSVNKTGELTTTGQLSAVDTNQLTSTIEYKIQNDIIGRYQVETYQDESVKLILLDLPSEDKMDILILEVNF